MTDCAGLFVNIRGGALNLHAAAFPTAGLEAHGTTEACAEAVVTAAGEAVAAGVGSVDDDEDEDIATAEVEAAAEGPATTLLVLRPGIALARTRQVD